MIFDLKKAVTKLKKQSSAGDTYAGDKVGVTVESIIENFPVSADYLLDLVNSVSESRGTLGVIATIGLILSGTAVFSAVRKGINHAWHVGEPHYFFLERGIDLLMLLGVALLALFAAVLSTNVLGLAPLEETSVWLLDGPIGKVFFETFVLAATFGKGSPANDGSNEGGLKSGSYGVRNEGSSGHCVTTSS